jgi:hypothetical protein
MMPHGLGALTVSLLVSEGPPLSAAAADILVAVAVGEAGSKTRAVMTSLDCHIRPSSRISYACSSAREEREVE